MAAVRFHHKFAGPFPAGANAYEVAIKAYVVDGGAVILDDEDGTTHGVGATGEPGSGTHQERAHAGTKALIVNIAGRLGISTSAEEITEENPPT